MIRNWYNQIPHPALKTKREITKYINWRQFTKGIYVEIKAIQKGMDDEMTTGMSFVTGKLQE